MISLETLRAHALKNPDKKFPVGSCTECLAADLTAGKMIGHQHVAGGETVDPRFASFTRRLCHQSYEDGVSAVYTGAALAAGVAAIEAGTNPVQAADDVWKNRPSSPNG